MSLTKTQLDDLAVKINAAYTKASECKLDVGQMLITVKADQGQGTFCKCRAPDMSRGRDGTVVLI